MGLPAVVSQEDPGRLGPYELVERLGQGGMAIVYRARAPGSDRDIVLKAMLPNLVHSKPLVAMFQEEARLTGELRHENIVRVEDYGVAGDIPYLTMEYLDGRNLSQIRVVLNRLKRRVPIGVAIAVGHGLCRALGYAHQFVNARGQRMQIIHRDVSPSNVMVQRDGSVKLLDFGVAKLSSEAGAAVTSSLKGKFAYMAPEQVNQEPIDRRCDVFAAGVVLHELLTGKRLFGTKSERETLRRVALAEASPPSWLNPEVPGGLDDIIMRALSRRADDRYDSGHQMAEALEKLAASAPAAELAELVEDLFPLAAETLVQPEPFDSDTEISGRGVSFEEAEGRAGGVASAPHLVLLPNDDAIIDEMADEQNSVTGREIRLNAEPSTGRSLPELATISAPHPLGDDNRPTRIYDSASPAVAPMVVVDMKDTAPERAELAPDVRPSSAAIEDLLDAEIMLRPSEPELSPDPPFVPVASGSTDQCLVSDLPAAREPSRGSWWFLVGGLLGVALVCGGVVLKLRSTSVIGPTPTRSTDPVSQTELAAPRSPEPSLLPHDAPPAGSTAALGGAPGVASSAPPPTPSLLLDLDEKPVPRPTKAVVHAKASAPQSTAKTTATTAKTTASTAKTTPKTSAKAARPGKSDHPRPSVKEGGIVDPFDGAE